MKMLSKEEIRKLFQNSGLSLLWIAVNLAFAGFLHKGKIVALTWNNIDFKNDTIFINKTLK